MFRLFGNWNTYLTSEIREGKHLDKAQKTDYKEFFKKSTFVRLSQWTILHVTDDKIYWGKANQDRVDKYCFFRTSKKAIEHNFVTLDQAKKKSLLDILQKYIQEHLNLIDGAQFSIQNITYESVEITTETNFHIVLNVGLSIKPTTLNPETREETRTFNLVVHPHNFALIKLD